MDVFPTEIIQEILHHLKPTNTSSIIAEDAAWNFRGSDIPNWWSPKEYASGEKEEYLKPYRHVFLLRL
jgi:hypothetical protein